MLISKQTLQWSKILQIMGIYGNELTPKNSFAMLCPHFQPHPNNKNKGQNRGVPKRNVYQLGRSDSMVLSPYYLAAARGCWPYVPRELAPIWRRLEVFGVLYICCHTRPHLWNMTPNTPYTVLKTGSTKRFQGLIFQDVYMDVRILAW